MWFPHIAIDLVFVLDMVILYFLASQINTKNINTVWAERTIVEC